MTRKKIGWYVEMKDERGRVHRETRNGLPDDVFVEFDAAVHKLAETFFERDEDGDLPIRIYLSDCTTHGPNHYGQLWHAGKATTAQLLQNLEIAAGNCQQAGEEMRRVYYQLQDLLRAKLGKELTG